MKTTPLLLKSAICCFCTVAIFFRTTAQITPTLIPGNIYGQPIVDCSGHSGSAFSFAATGAAIYCRAFGDTVYNKVWNAPGGTQIIGFSNKTENGNNYRAILLRSASSNHFVVYNKIKAPAADSAVYGPVQLPAPPVGKYTRIAAGKDIYAYSFQQGGPLGNLMVSYDDAQTWTPDTLGLGYSAVGDFAVDTSQNLFILSNGILYKQLPGNSVLTLINSNTNGAQKIFIDRLNRILVTSLPVTRTYISTNGGTTFNNDSAGLVGAIKFMADDLHGNLYAVTSNSSSKRIFANTGGTGTWTEITAGFNDVADIYTNVTCFSGDSTVIIGSNNGMFTSTNSGNTWAPSNYGIRAEDIYGLITQPTGRLICTTDFGIFYKDPSEADWHRATQINNYLAQSLLFNDPNGAAFATYGPTINTSPYPLLKSTSNGDSWHLDTLGLSDVGGTAFYVDETGGRHYYNYYGTNIYNLTAWYSPVSSTNWSLDTAGLPVFPTFGTGVKGFCSDKQGYLYASVDLPGGNLIYRRPIAGTQWVLDTAGLGATLEVTVLASHQNFGIVLAVGTQLYRRAVSGWVQIPSLPGFENISALAVDKRGVIFAAENIYSNPDSSGLYYTTDTGASWHLAGLTGMDIYGLSSSGDTTYALTYGNWGYMFVSGSLVGIPNAKATLSSSVNVFPNPSSTGWTIVGDEALNGADLQIFDLTGRLIRTQIFKTNMFIDASKLLPGTYVLNIAKTGFVNYKHLLIRN